MCDCTSQSASVDLQTPRNAYLTAFYKRSFAHHTVKNRMPIIITQTVDSLARNKEQIGNKYGEKGQEELKVVIGELSKLKYEIQTNKPFRNLTSNGADVKFYNDYIATQSAQTGNITFFTAIWLLSECYMYRRVREAFELTSRLKKFDPFLTSKQQAYENSLSIIMKLSQHLTDVLNKWKSPPNQEEFVELLKINLWGNRCDLSLSNGVVSSNNDHLFNIEQLEPFILCDHSEKIWEAVSQHSSTDIVDIVFDNAGYELFTDLCLADYLLTKRLADQVRFYVKSFGWFISDVMKPDFYWLLEQLKTSNDTFLQLLGKKWTRYVEDKKWTIVESDFWTLPIDYSQMGDVNRNLYKKLAQAKVVIFKGDLNYRKLFGERNWDPTTPVDDALQGFHPTKLCSLRTIKADIVCGLEPGVAEKTEAVNSKWMETGEYGLIQFSGKKVLI